MAVTLRNAVSLAALLVIGCADDPSGVVLADAMAIDAASFDAPSAADSPDGSAVDSGLPKRSLDPASYNDWQAPITIDDSTPTASDGSVLVKDCHIRSVVAGTPAIRIRTSKMVRIRSCVLMGTGIVSGAHGVVLLDAGDGNLDIDDTLFFSRRLGVKGAMPARAVSLPYDFTSVRIVNSYLDGTSGILLHGENKANKSTVEIRENRVRNIDGRFEDPTQADGVVHSNVWNGPTGVYGFAPSQFLLLQNVNAPNMYEVDDNDVLNEPGKSRVEDLINLYESTGSIGAPLAHRRNLFIGAYPYDWGFDPKSNTGFWGNNVPSQGSTAANQAIGRLDDARGLAFSGGGGLSGDGAATSGIVQQYAVFDGSTLVNVFNYGHQIAGGKNASIVNRNIVNSGYVRGLPGIRSSWGEQPIQVIFYPNPATPDPSWWGGHQVLNDACSSRWFSPFDSQWHEQNFFITTTTGVTVAGIVNVPNASTMDEDKAIQAHRDAWVKANKLAGPRT